MKSNPPTAHSQLQNLRSPDNCPDIDEFDVTAWVATTFAVTVDHARVVVELAGLGSAQ
jgi:hypothetical protein